MDVKAYIESGIIESYVLGMTSAAESAELEQLKRQYPAIQEAIDAFEASLEQSLLSDARQPVAHVKAAIMQTIELENPAQKQAPVIPLTRLRLTAAAAIILLVVSATTNLYFYRQFKEVNQQYMALLAEKTTLLAQQQSLQTRSLDLYEGMQIMSDPAVAKISMPGIKPEEGKLATVFWDRKTRDVYVLPNKLPQAAAGTQYQLWAIVDGKPVDAGLIDACNGLCKMKNIPAAAAFAITLEKTGGSSTPNLQQLQVMGQVNG